MAKLSSAGATNWPTFADRKMWEVVVQHELLGVLLHQPFHSLFVTSRSQGDADHCLRLASLEYGRSVRAGQNIDMAFDGPECCCIATVRPRPGQNQIANDSALQFVPGMREGPPLHGVFGIRVRNHFGHGAFFQSRNGTGSLQLAPGLLGRLEFVVVLVLELVEKAIVFRRFERRLFHTDLLVQLPLQSTHFLDHAMTELDRFDHVIFRHLASETFDHRHCLFRARHDQVQIAFLQLVLRRERHKFAVDAPDTSRGDRPVEGHRRNEQSSGRSVHGQEIRVVLHVGRKNDGLTLDFIVEAFGEQWSDGPIH